MAIAAIEEQEHHLLNRHYEIKNVISIYDTVKWVQPITRAIEEPSTGVVSDLQFIKVETDAEKSLKHADNVLLRASKAMENFEKGEEIPTVPSTRCTKPVTRIPVPKKTSAKIRNSNLVNKPVQSKLKPATVHQSTVTNVVSDCNVIKDVPSPAKNKPLQPIKNNTRFNASLSTLAKKLHALRNVQTTIQGEEFINIFPVNCEVATSNNFDPDLEHRIQCILKILNHVKDNYDASQADKIEGIIRATLHKLDSICESSLQPSVLSALTKVYAPNKSCESVQSSLNILYYSCLKDLEDFLMKILSIQSKFYDAEILKTLENVLLLDSLSAEDRQQLIQFALYIVNGKGRYTPPIVLQ